MGRAKSKTIGLTPARLDRMIAIPDKYDLTEYQSLTVKFERMNQRTRLKEVVEAITSTGLDNYIGTHFEWLFSQYAPYETAIPQILHLLDDKDLLEEFEIKVENSYPETTDDLIKPILDDLTQINKQQAAIDVSRTGWERRPLSKSSFGSEELIKAVITDYKNELARLVVLDEEKIACIIEESKGTQEVEGMPRSTVYIQAHLKSQIVRNKVLEMNQIATQIILAN